MKSGLCIPWPDFRQVQQIMMILSASLELSNVSWGLPMVDLPEQSDSLPYLQTLA